MPRSSFGKWLTAGLTALGLWWLLGRKAGGAPPGGQTLYPVDDWVVETALDGTQTTSRFSYLVAGYSGGTLMSRDEAFIRFSGLPATVSQAFLEVPLLEYVGVTPYSATLSIGGLVVGTDNATPPATVRFDVTAFVQAAVAGELLVNIAPQVATENYLRRYGSVRATAPLQRPRIVVA